MNQYRVGNIVECIISSNYKEDDWNEEYSGGVGWKLGRVFKIARISRTVLTDPNTEVLWPEDNDKAGVFSHSVKHVKKQPRIKLFNK